jgi:hypothetical protein
VHFSTVGWGHEFKVTNNNDAGPNSFRQAILDANAIVGKDTIQVEISDTLFLETAELPGFTILPPVEDSLCIFGNGVTLKAEITGRIMRLSSPCEIYFISFTGGVAPGTGGAVRTTAVAGYCRFISCNFMFNHAPGTGGGLYTRCSAELNNCYFESNTADEGGGLAMTGADIQVCLNDCTFKDNIGTSHGGAVRVQNGTLVVNEATFENTAGPFEQTIYLLFGAAVVLDPGFEVVPPSRFVVIIGP